MFGNPFLDSLPEYDVLTNICDKCENENAINHLSENVKVFILFRKYLSQRQGQEIPLSDLYAIEINFDRIWLCCFLIAFREGFERVKMNSESVRYG